MIRKNSLRSPRGSDLAAAADAQIADQLTLQPLFLSEMHACGGNSGNPAGVNTGLFPVYRYRSDQTPAGMIDLRQVIYAVKNAHEVWLGNLSSKIMSDSPTKGFGSLFT